MGELAIQFDAHPNHIKQWEDQLLAGVTSVFDSEPSEQRDLTSPA